jgi:hypothetical protein
VTFSGRLADEFIAEMLRVSSAMAVFFADTSRSGGSLAPLTRHDRLFVAHKG